MEENKKGKLYLIPTLLGEIEPLEVLPLAVRKVIDMTDYFIVENEKSARHFIKRVHPSKNQPDLQLNVLNKYTDPSDLESFLNPCLQGHHMGLLSEAGSPGIADPGADVVAMAHSKGIHVAPLVGPSSITLGMMASGMNGQNFAFNGYMPIDKKERKQRIKELERTSREKNQSQIFIETPYRNMSILEDILQTCSDHTRLCIASEITLASEYIRTQTIAEWKKGLPDLNKKPTIFILHR
jgi:16S rRNA (cytidine1402-2'-O)-methyltransferase